jgi:hypothetical protein
MRSSFGTGAFHFEIQRQNEIQEFAFGSSRNFVERTQVTAVHPEGSPHLEVRL